MHTNRLNDVADRLRLSSVRDLFFVIMIALILVLQIVSLSQARASAQDLWNGVEEAPATRMAQPEHCIQPSSGELAGAPGGGPLC